MATFISNSPAETESLGEAWGKAAQTGWVLGLSGDLGTGKTQLVKGLARGLGVQGRIHSPTFALLNEYTGGRIPLFHLDFYRLETRKQIIGAGLEEYIQRPDGVAVVEWIERWGTEEMRNERIVHTRESQKLFRLVRIEALDETRRRITYEDFGS